MLNGLPADTPYRAEVSKPPRVFYNNFDPFDFRSLGSTLSVSGADFNAGSGSDTYSGRLSVSEIGEEWTLLHAVVGPNAHVYFVLLYHRGAERAIFTNLAWTNTWNVATLCRPQFSVGETHTLRTSNVQETADIKLVTRAGSRYTAYTHADSVQTVFAWMYSRLTRDLCLPT
jgi:hypothetical protein